MCVCVCVHVCVCMCVSVCVSVCGVCLCSRNVQYYLATISLQFFQKSLKPVHESDPDALIGAAFKIKYNAKKMKR